MYLWIGLALGLIISLIDPFTSRLHATGLWAGKVLAPMETASVMPRGLQDAITAGWPSALSFWVSTLLYAPAILGIIHAWWGGLVLFFVTSTFIAITQRTSIAPRTVDRYIVLFYFDCQSR
jgi:hypothetical protein